MHVDAGNRDSLAFDIVEPVRPRVDEYPKNLVVWRPPQRSIAQAPPPEPLWPSGKRAQTATGGHKARRNLPLEIIALQ